MNTITNDTQIESSCAVIHIAKHMLSEMFDIDVKDFVESKARKSKVIEARRFFIYFLFKELEIRKYRILGFVPAISNHATVLYHIKKMEELMELEKPLRKRYEDFKYNMINQIF